MSFPKETEGFQVDAAGNPPDFHKRSVRLILTVASLKCAFRSSRWYLGTTEQTKSLTKFKLKQFEDYGSCCWPVMLTFHLSLTFHRCRHKDGYMWRMWERRAHSHGLVAPSALKLAFVKHEVHRKTSHCVWDTVSTLKWRPTPQSITTNSRSRNLWPRCWDWP